MFREPPSFLKSFNVFGAIAGITSYLITIRIAFFTLILLPHKTSMIRNVFVSPNRRTPIQNRKKCFMLCFCVTTPRLNEIFSRIPITFPEINVCDKFPKFLVRFLKTIKL